MKRNKKKKLKTTIFVLLALLVAIGAGAYFIMNNSSGGNSGELAQAIYDRVQEDAETGISDAISKGDLKKLDEYNKKYGKFILVDISEQNLYFYKDGKLELKADIISGTKGENDTPVGTYKIFSKLENINITGPSWNYKVKYWMGFIENVYGFHDAYWQEESEFRSKNAYEKEGSHGCINMLEEDIAKLFSMVEEGDAVIIQE